MSAARFLMTYFPSRTYRLTTRTMAISEMWPSFNGVSYDMSKGRSEWASASRVLSTLEMHHECGEHLWINSCFLKALHNRRRRADNTLPVTAENNEKKSRRLVNGRTISDPWNCCIRLFNTRKSTLPFKLQGTSFGVRHLCNGARGS